MDTHVCDDGLQVLRRASKSHRKQNRDSHVHAKLEYLLGRDARREVSHAKPTACRAAVCASTSNGPFPIAFSRCADALPPRSAHVRSQRVAQPLQRRARFPERQACAPKALNGTIRGGGALSVAQRLARRLGHGLPALLPPPSRANHACCASAVRACADDATTHDTG